MRHPYHRPHYGAADDHLRSGDPAKLLAPNLSQQVELQPVKPPLPHHQTGERRRAATVITIALVGCACHAGPGAGMSVLPAAMVRDAPRFVARAPFAPARVTLGSTPLREVRRSYGDAKIDWSGETSSATGYLCYRLDGALLTFHATGVYENDAEPVIGLTIAVFPPVEPGRRQKADEDCAPANALGRALVAGAVLRLGATPKHVVRQMGEPTSRWEDEHHHKLALRYEANVPHQTWRYQLVCNFFAVHGRFVLDRFFLERYVNV